MILDSFSCRHERLFGIVSTYRASGCHRPFSFYAKNVLTFKKSLKALSKTKLTSSIKTVNLTNVFTF